MAFSFLALEHVTVTLGGRKILEDVSFSIGNNEQWAVTGSSGSGKTTLAHTLAGKHYHTGSLVFHSRQSLHNPTIVVVEQQHRFKNLSNTSDFYYQQRYNASDAENTLTVSAVLASGKQSNDKFFAGIPGEELPALLHIEELMEKPLIQLSNGENKRLQIAKAILEQPELLILDNPFLGLDTEGRQILTRIINRLSGAGVKILLITTADEIPDCITHIAVLQDGRIEAAVPKKDFTPAILLQHKSFRINRNLLQELKKSSSDNFSYAIRMVDVHVQYGDKKILTDINWKVRKGEHWSISGPNGAGKSTLLSLITGDNAKAYANEIYLFDKRRGSGESIWDIKKKIGYVSPEMHLYFDYSATCFETIASGLFDSIGLFRPLQEEHRLQVKQWLNLLQLETIQNKLLSQLSAGEQRLVLLARALVKNPPLLILDEPCQGLDKEHVEQFRTIINDICEMFDTTLLYVSHYKEEIPACVNSFLRIENGKAWSE